MHYNPHTTSNISYEVWHFECITIPTLQVTLVMKSDTSFPYPHTTSNISYEVWHFECITIPTLQVTLVMKSDTLNALQSSHYK